MNDKVGGLPALGTLAWKLLLTPHDSFQYRIGSNDSRLYCHCHCRSYRLDRLGVPVEHSSSIVTGRPDEDMKSSEGRRCLSQASIHNTEYDGRSFNMPFTNLLFQVWNHYKVLHQDRLYRYVTASGGQVQLFDARHNQQDDICWHRLHQILIIRTLGSRLPSTSL
ncbi:hypothetical protein BDQ12DRAFT_43501 [Crucibulum laeve]|uniref:Uncharacterized protein n=1 Tax=Crucibulum laeve TaxID=68775 RepID=A0A5C3MKR5_9AGAR|nr:hypothetical protein BDQ12DRAFT_43501 [Crucibulum laeve]